MYVELQKQKQQLRQQLVVSSTPCSTVQPYSRIVYSIASIVVLLRLSVLLRCLPPYSVLRPYTTAMYDSYAWCACPQILSSNTGAAPARDRCLPPSIQSIHHSYDSYVSSVKYRSRRADDTITLQQDEDIQKYMVIYIATDIIHKYRCVVCIVDSSSRY